MASSTAIACKEFYMFSFVYLLSIDVFSKSVYMYVLISFNA